MSTRTDRAFSLSRLVTACRISFAQSRRFESVSSTALYKKDAAVRRGDTTYADLAEADFLKARDRGNFWSDRHANLCRKLRLARLAILVPAIVEA